jgi:RNA-directed DNA polymerase
MGRDSALSKVSSVGSLGAAFNHIYTHASSKSRQTSGVDNQTLDDYFKRSDTLTKQLSKELKSGSFRFSRLSPHFIKKPSGKFRVICVPTVRDRIVQRSLLHYLGTKYENKIANQISFGFIPKKGVSKAVEQACNLRKDSPWVFKTDIASFFDEVDRTKLKERLRAMVREPSLYKLLTIAQN